MLELTTAVNIHSELQFGVYFQLRASTAMYDSLIDQWLLLTHGRFSQLLLYQEKWRLKMMLKMLRSFSFTKIMAFTKGALM